MALKRRRHLVENGLILLLSVDGDKHVKEKGISEALVRRRLGMIRE